MLMRSSSSGCTIIIPEGLYLARLKKRSISAKLVNIWGSVINQFKRNIKNDFTCVCESCLEEKRSFYSRH